MLDYNLEKSRFVIGGVATAIVAIYMIRLFTLQIMSDDYKKNADSNAFLKHIEFPARGAIYYRNGKLARKPVAGKDLSLGLDVKLQALGERLLQGKIGSIVAIDPRTGDVLAMVSSVGVFTI